MREQANELNSTVASLFTTTTVAAAVVTKALYNCPQQQVLCSWPASFKLKWDYICIERTVLI